MNTPTGGPKMRSQARYSHLVGAIALLAACAAALATSRAATAAEAQLRIIGSLTIEASASQLAGGSELNARLLDDAGHAVSGAELAIQPLFSSPALVAHDCQSRTVSLPANSSGAYLARSNDAGAVCVRFDGAPAQAEFALNFRDQSGLYGAASARVVADNARRNVEMAFAPAPTVFALERETQVISLATRPVPALAAGEAVERLEIAFAAKRDSAQKPLGTSSVEIGSTSEFRWSSRLLGGPGPCEISAEFAGSPSTRKARATAHVTVTALAELSLAEPLGATHPESGVALRVRVHSVAGKVPSGSVEARSAGVSLGSARVNAGAAELYFRMGEREAQAHPVELRYVPDLPWWLPGATLSVAIPVAPPSPWRRVVWIAAVAALGSWLLMGWQRPRRLERASSSAVPLAPLRVPVDVIEVGDPHSGWRGRVIDAHDGSAIAGATVCLRLPSFQADGVLVRAQSETDGSFVLEGHTPAGPGAALEVRAPYHAPLAAPMPPPGTLLLSLTSRRRTLLARFVDWATHEHSPARGGEATPGEVARRADRPEVAAWASAVDEAAFGPDPLSEAKEQVVVGREPPHARKLQPKEERS